MIREDSQIDFAAGNVFFACFFFGGGGFYASQILAIIDFFKHWKNLITGLPLTWKTWKSQGIWKRPLKVREFATEFQKSGKSQGILLSEIHFQPS